MEFADTLEPNLVGLPQTPQKKTPEPQSRHLFAPKLHQAISDRFKPNLMGLPQTPQKSTPDPESRYLFHYNLHHAISDSQT